MYVVLSLILVIAGLITKATPVLIASGLFAIAGAIEMYGCK